MCPSGAQVRAEPPPEPTLQRGRHGIQPHASRDFGLLVTGETLTWPLQTYVERRRPDTESPSVYVAASRLGRTTRLSAGAQDDPLDM